jgi:hypothetical protein
MQAVFVIVGFCSSITAILVTAKHTPARALHMQYCSSDLFHLRKQLQYSRITVTAAAASAVHAA